MNYFSINNWEKYQHYSKRNPPWIKLYNSLLDDYEYTRLQDASKLLLISLFMLASRCDNEIPADPEWIQQKGMLLGDIDLQPLISAGFIKLNGKDASIPLATCKHDASNMLHQSRDRAETEKKIYKRKVPLPKDYKLTQEHIEYAKSKGITQGFEGIFEDFCIHHRKVGSKWTDWYAAWQTWIRKRIEFNKGSPIQPGIEYDGTAVDEMNQELEKITPEQRAKNKEWIKKLAGKSTKKV